MIRRATADDLDTLLGMSRRYCEHDRHTFDVERARAGFSPLLVDDVHGVVWMLGDEAGDAGYAVITWGWSIESGGRDALLDEIYVERRSDGLGSAAVQHILEDCRGRGMCRIFLETEARNRRARALYARFGFALEDSVWMSREL